MRFPPSLLISEPISDVRQIIGFMGHRVTLTGRATKPRRTTHHLGDRWAISGPLIRFPHSLRASRSGSGMDSHPGPGRFQGRSDLGGPPWVVNSMIT